MTSVIAHPCVDVKDRGCVDECPVDCVCEGQRMLYIHPDECVDWGACEHVCPVEAIFYEDDVSVQWASCTAINAELFDEIGSPGGAARGRHHRFCRTDVVVEQRADAAMPGLGADAVNRGTVHRGRGGVTSTQGVAAPAGRRSGRTGPGGADRISRGIRSRGHADDLGLSLVVGRGATDGEQEAAGVDADVGEMECGDLAGPQRGDGERVGLAAAGCGAQDAAQSSANTPYHRGEVGSSLALLMVAVRDGGRSRRPGCRG